MCDSAALFVGETVERPFSPHPEQPDFWKPQPMGGVVSFFPVLQKCGSLGNVCLGWSVWGESRLPAPSGPLWALQVFSFSRPSAHQLLYNSYCSNNERTYKTTMCQEPCWVQPRISWSPQ